MAHPLRIDAAELVREDHLALQRRLKLVEQSLARPATPDEIWHELRALELELAEHFRHEEQEGFFDSLLEAAPQLADRLAALRREHDGFRSQVCALRELAAVPALGPSLRAELSNRYAALVKSFEEHERAERRLVQEVSNQDMGLAD
jgi:iron-sulfur cluster repair protein YtfE (RIC family)